MSNRGLGALLTRLDALEAENRTLTARVAALEAAKPRDAQDATLRQQMAVSTRGLLFRSNDLGKHAGVDLELKQALVRADVCSVEAIGLWLRANRGVRDGILIERCGRKWRAVHVEHVTCSDHL